MSKVSFVKTVEVKKDRSLLELAQAEKIKIKAPCDGKGKCGKCLVKIVSGKVNPPTKNELKSISSKKLEEGYRLACEITEMEDLVVQWPSKKSK